MIAEDVVVRPCRAELLGGDGFPSGRTTPRAGCRASWLAGWSVARSTSWMTRCRVNRVPRSRRCRAPIGVGPRIRHWSTIARGGRSASSTRGGWVRRPAWWSARVRAG